MSSKQNRYDEPGTKVLLDEVHVQDLAGTFEALWNSLRESIRSPKYVKGFVVAVLSEYEGQGHAFRAMLGDPSIVRDLVTTLEEDICYKEEEIAEYMEQAERRQHNAALVNALREVEVAQRTIEIHREAEEIMTRLQMLKSELASYS